MHTQTDIQILIEGTSELADERKKELLTVLPDFYAVVLDSLLLDEEWKSKLLFAFPYLADNQRQDCLDILSAGQEELEEKLMQIMQQVGGNFEQELSELEKLLEEGEKVLSHADDEVKTMFMEEDFSQGGQ
jgi:hypothetical protein